MGERDNPMPNNECLWCEQPMARQTRDNAEGVLTRDYCCPECFDLGNGVA